MPTIIYPPSIPWNWMFQRPQQLLLHLSALGYQVLYEDLGKFDNPNLQTLSPSFSLYQGVPASSLATSSPRILWLTVPYHIGLISDYRPDLVVYDAVDEPKEEFASWAPYYPEILAKSDLMFASAQSIFNDLSERHPNVHLIPNGVDFQHFAQKQPRPTDLPASLDLIGYSGAIAPWVDWDLLDYVVRENPALTFVFIGSLFQMKKFPLQRKNVKYLGLKHYSQLPGYLQHFKIGLIPFRLTEMTKGCNPIKLYEYYAAGLPVLATPLPELYAIPKIHLENDPQKFSKRLSVLIVEGNAGHVERLAFAQENDWSMRAGKIKGHIQKIIQMKGY